MKHIAVGGFLHETNTFKQQATRLVEFQQADNWPAKLEGNQIARTLRNMNIPLAGFLQKIQQHKYMCSGLTWCAAPPSGKVTHNAYTHITEEILSKIQTLEIKPDVIYLDLHGAMVAAEHTDADGILLENIRKLVGGECWIIASLDLHANVSQKMFEHSDLLLAYKTYPHIDLAETGEQIATTLHNYICSNTKPIKIFRQLDTLIPITSQCTLIEPCKSIYQEIKTLEKQCNCNISFNPGFPLADTDHTGPSLLIYGQSATETQICADSLEQSISAKLTEFTTDYHQDSHIIHVVNNIEKIHGRPIILADTQDNPGCGGAGDTTGILREFLQHDMQSTLFACLFDHETAELAFHHKIGDTLEIQLGEKSPDAKRLPLTTVATLLFKSKLTIN